MARVIETAELIQAVPSCVWSVLMGFDAYSSWNPFIRGIAGESRVGSELDVVVAPPGGKPQPFRPVVTEFVPERRFCWRGSLPITGLFTGEHRFALEAEGPNTRFTQSEAFSDLPVPFVGGILAATERGFQAMNGKLKGRAEGS